MNIIYIVGGAIVLLWLFGGLYRHSQGRNRVLNIIEENCTGCKHCVKRCGHKALEAINDENGTRIVINHDRCTGCGDCISACKFNALELITKI
jgi:NAD-dependent dihydropyrimidine dehydrogenase PreA subunit